MKINTTHFIMGVVSIAAGLILWLLISPVIIVYGEVANSFLTVSDFLGLAICLVGVGLTICGIGILMR